MPTSEIIALASAVATVSLFIIAYFQLKYFRDQLTFAYPPSLNPRFLHIWEKDKGKVFSPDNEPPPDRAGVDIEGAMFIRNFGREQAMLVSSDLYASYHRPPIGMNFPGWNNPGKNSLRHSSAYPDYLPGRQLEILRPGEVGQWRFSTTISEKYSLNDLVVSGSVAYKDRLGTFHELIFAYRYDTKMVRFKEEYYSEH